MGNKSLLKNSCRVTTNTADDCFVGMRIKNGTLEICFPVGFSLSTSEVGLREDVNLLFTTLSRGRTVRDGNQPIIQSSDTRGAMPFSDYLIVLDYYFSNGYYSENERVFSSKKNGTIDWKRTIKNGVPYPQGNSCFVYLDSVKRASIISSDNLITLIHKYYVRKGLLAIGWLFTDYVPPEENYRFNEISYLEILNQKINQTFNDADRRLFLAMRNLLLSSPQHNTADMYWGTYRFDRVWELMIDDVFGVRDSDKRNFFPSSKWNLRVGDVRQFDNTYLIPDTIMYLGNEIFVLDAKYYHYSQTWMPSDLPSSSDINKQVSYGEYAFEHHPQGYVYDTVYNAFLLPFDKELCDNKSAYMNIGEAVCTWQRGIGNQPYSHVLGLLIDTKSLMMMPPQSEHEKRRLRNLIKSAFMDSAEEEATNTDSSE